MNKKPITIKELEMPNVMVNESKYTTLCEYEAKDRLYQTVYVKDGGHDVVIEGSNDSAIVGLFSTEPSKINMLFDYIESTISPKQGLGYYLTATMRNYLEQATQNGGTYPVIQGEISDQKPSFFSKLSSRLHAHKGLDKSLANEVQLHMTPVIHEIEDQTIDADLCAEDFDDEPTRTPASSLPEGWMWVQWDDGSGHIESPDGKDYFSYDRKPYYFSHGIEYKETEDGVWDIFWGSMAEFEKYVKSVVSERYLQEKEVSVSASRSEVENAGLQTDSAAIQQAAAQLPFAAFITNLGKYSEGELAGEWVKFPTTADEMKAVFERIGIGSTDEFGHPYEEWFITDYYCYVGGLYDKLGEYVNLDELNYLAARIEEMDRSEYNQFLAAMEMGEHTGSLQDIINLTYNLDCYDVYPDIEDHDDLGRYYIDELDAMQVPEHLKNYIDYEAYGRDVALNEGGSFTEFGYVRNTGGIFYKVYKGDWGNIPDEYRVMTFLDGAEPQTNGNAIRQAAAQLPFAPAEEPELGGLGD